jgi:hypothetical protein
MKRRQKREYEVGICSETLHHITFVTGVGGLKDVLSLKVPKQCYFVLLVESRLEER